MISVSLLSFQGVSDGSIPIAQFLEVLVITPVRSAMSSIRAFHPHKLSIVLMAYNLDGGRTGRGECMNDAMIHLNRTLNEGIITIAGHADGSTHSM